MKKYRYGDGTMPEGDYYLASEVDARTAELDKASDIAIQINNDLHKRIDDLEQALRASHACCCRDCADVIERLLPDTAEVHCTAPNGTVTRE